MLANPFGEQEMLDAKSGEGLLARPNNALKNIEEALIEFARFNKQKEDDYKLYSVLTGNKFSSVIEHKADSSRKVIRDASVTQPLQRVAQERRNALRDKLEQSSMAINRVVTIYSSLPAELKEEMDEALASARIEMTALNVELVHAEEEVTDLFLQSQELEKQYAYSYVDGKRVYSREGAMNEWHREILKKGRTAVGDFARFTKIKGIDHSVYNRAREVFHV